MVSKASLLVVALLAFAAVIAYCESPEGGDVASVDSVDGLETGSRELLGRRYRPSFRFRKRRTKNKVYQKNKSNNKNYGGVIYNPQKNAVINGDHGYIEQNDAPVIINNSYNRHGRLLLGRRRKPSFRFRKRSTKNKVYQKNKSRNKNYGGVIYNPQKNAVINGDHSYIGQNDHPYIENFSNNVIG